MNEERPEIELVLEVPPGSPLSLNEHHDAEGGGATGKRRSSQREKVETEKFHLPFKPGVGPNGQTRAARV